MENNDRILKQHSLGKLTAMERISLLFDENTFVEIDKDLFDGVITGYGLVAGKKVFVSSQDFTYHGGTLGMIHANKIWKVMDMAYDELCPYVSINDSGGARIDEGITALNGYAGIFYRNTKMSGVVPQIAAIMGPCAGGACYSPSICDFVFMVKEHSQMFITGPGVVKAVTGETVTTNDLGGCDVHNAISGCANFSCESDNECILKIRKLLEFLPCNYSDTLVKNNYTYSRRDAHLVVNQNIKRTYNIKTFLCELVDDDSFFEVSADFAKNIVTAFATFNGNKVGIVANNPYYYAGVLDINSSDKASRFVRFCDCFNIPIITFVDTPGYLPGKDQEHNGIIRHGGKLLFSYSESTVLKISIILRRAFGGAYIAMSSKGIGSNYCFAWNDSQIAVMGAEGAVDIIYKREIANSENREEAKQNYIKEYVEKYMNPKTAKENGYIDEIIEPCNTRKIIVDLLVRTVKETKIKKIHSNIPL